MKPLSRFMAVFVSASLAFTMMPTVAFAAGADGEAAVSASMLDSAEANTDEFVYNKADFYQEAEDGISPWAMLRSPSITPVYISDEMKYFTKYESSCNYDQGFSSGDGYHALGYYQFDHRYGLKDFLAACYSYNPTTYSMFAQFESIPDPEFKDQNAIRSNGSFTDLGNKLNQAWHAAYAANPSEFAALQDGWAYTNYYLPAKSYLESIGIDISSRADCAKGLCWGMSSLFGSGGWRKFVIGSGVSNSMSDVEFVTTLCNYVVNNVASFYPSQPQYHQGWQNRYKRELNDCLTMLASSGKWVAEGDRWRYIEGDTYKTNSWLYRDGIWYWFDTDGYAAQNSLEHIKGAWYWFDSDCGMLTNAWKKIQGDWYYLSSSGSAITGWGAIKNTWYYFNTATAVMQIGWLEIGDIRYYLDDSGAMVTGWMDDGDSRYYFRSSGAMATGWVQTGEQWYYLRSSGVMATGWVQSSEQWYWLDPGDGGAMATGWRDVEGARYYLRSSGAMASSCWVQTNEQWYYLSDSGALLKSQWVDGCYVDDTGKWVQDA